MLDIRLVEDGSNRNVVFGFGLTKIPDTNLIYELKRGVGGLLKVHEDDIDEGVIVYSIADVVTMDVEMPRKDGLAALEEIMRVRPMPV